MRWVLLVIGGLAIGFAVAFFAISRTGNGALETQAKAVLAKVLFDPYSAVYDGVRIINDGRDHLVCGTVNAKNRLGGYVGAKPFLYNVRSGAACLVNNHRDAFICGDILKSCFPQMRVPSNAAAADRWDRGLSW